MSAVRLKGERRARKGLAAGSAMRRAPRGAGRGGGGANGTFWWPIGLLAGAGARGLAARIGSRQPAIPARRSPSEAGNCAHTRSSSSRRASKEFVRGAESRLEFRACRKSYHRL